jgi:hypothetical protein
LRAGWAGAGRVQGEAYTALSTLLSGIAVFGGAGYGLDRLFGTGPFLLVAGILLGKGLGAYLVYARHAAETPAPEYTPVRSAAGWSKAVHVAGAAPEPHPKADLSGLIRTERPHAS